MVNFCLNDNEKILLKNLIGKKLIKFRHDPLDKFDGGTVYGRIELFFDDLIVLLNYDYEPYPLFGINQDDHPKFCIKYIDLEEAVSAFQNVEQINIRCNKIIQNITLVEDYIEVEWEGKNDTIKELKAIIFKFKNDEYTIQGDYMIPLLDIIKGEDTATQIIEPAYEFKKDTEVKVKADRHFTNLNDFNI